MGVPLVPGKPSPIYFLQSAAPVQASHDCAYAKTNAAFDFEGTQAYMNCYYSGYQGSPSRIGYNLQKRQEQAGKYANPLVPTLSPGLTYMNPANSLDPHDQMKYQILEAAMAPKFSGYNIYAGSDIDLGDLRNIAAANEILSRFEDIFIDGKLVKGLQVSENNSSVRAKILGEHILLLVADYSTYQPIETQVKVILPLHFTDKFTDIETEEQLVFDGKGGHLTVNLGERRVRLFYGGSGWKR